MFIITILFYYLDYTKITVVFIIVLIILSLFLLLNTHSSLISEKIKSKYFHKSKFALLIKNIPQKKIEEKNENLAKILIKGYHINEENERSNNYRLEEKIRNIEDLHIKNGAMDKNEKLLNMFIESIVSLNSWKNSKIENEILRKINWNIDKKEEDSVVPQYVFINTNTPLETVSILVSGLLLIGRKLVGSILFNS